MSNISDSSLSSTNAARASQPLFIPKLLSCLKDYSLKIFWGDLTSGIIVGIVALPLAIAFAIASGVTPDRGITTAIIAGFLISALGGSRVQIGGPTGAFVVIVYGIVEHHGINGLIIATVMAGVILVLMGVLRLGAIIRFIPYPVTVGFTSGIAVVIFSSQIKDFFGLQMGAVPGDFIDKWQLYFLNINTLNPTAALLSLLTVGIIFLWPCINKRIPGSIISIIAVTALVHFLKIPVETIGSRFGSIPTGLPHPSIPHFSFPIFKELIGPAFTIAILGSIESLLSATVADSMIEGRHRSNTELIAQGIANIITPHFGGIPATGAIARTATNIKNGGKTPVAGIVHAITLLGIVLIFGRWASLIPLCVFAGILVVVCYHMSEWHSFKALLRAPRMDIFVLLTTFTLTVLVDLTVAVEIGLLLSVVLFMKRMTDVTTVKKITEEIQDKLDEETLRKDSNATNKYVLPKGVEVFEAEGAFFFGVTETLRDLMTMGGKQPKAIILRMRHVVALDASGLRALNDLRKSCNRFGATLILEGIHAQPLFALEHGNFTYEFGRENIVGNMEDAIERAQQVIANA